MILAVQNTVAGRDIGTAMGAANLFRALGGAVGAAGLGSLFVAQVQAQLRQMPAGLTGLGESLQVSLVVVRELAPGARAAVIEAISSGLGAVFLVAAGAAAAAVCLSLLVPERPLRQDTPGG